MTVSGLADTIGTAAGTLTTLAFLPQVIKSWRTHSTNDISLIMFLAFCSGVGLWLIYGLMIAAWPVIVANSLTLALAGLILVMKLRHLWIARRR
jgi:MtN3 and saliva related transmembrane protein